MQVYPPLSKDEVAVYLAAHARLIWGETIPVSDTVLDTLAEALAMITAIDVPEDFDPLYP